jgi:phosphatidylglycerophosphatase A
MINKINFLFVTLLGVGKIKFAPGTFASALTMFVLFYFFHVAKIANEIILLSLIIIFFYSFYAIKIYIEDKENKDPKEVVVDEVIGQSIPLYLYEISHGGSKEVSEAFMYYIYIFFIFRFFDIKKPFPINFIDKNYKNSFGVVLDDVIAGLYAVITLIVFMIIKSKFF